METFEIMGEFIELNKLLKAVGICSTGGEANVLVRDGLVKVDGLLESRVRCKIRRSQIVEAGGLQVQVT